MSNSEQFASLEFPALLAQLSGFAQSALTRRLIEEIDVVFLPARVDKNLTQTSEAVNLFERFPGLDLPSFGLLEDLRDLWQHMSAGELPDTSAGRSMLRFTALCGQFDLLRKKFTIAEYPHLADCSAPWQSLSALTAETLRIFSEDGAVRDEASSALRNVREKLRRFEPQVQRTLAGYLRDVKQTTGEEALLSIRHQRFCVLVPRSAVHLSPGNVLDVSQSGQSIYFEPTALGALNTERQHLFLDEEQELRRILSQYCLQVAGAMQALEANLLVLAQFDFILARTRYAAELRAARPRMSHGGGFRLTGAVHPLLYRHFVPEDLCFDPQRCLIISGVNAGGKTVLLKILGLYSLMAAIGCFVPGDAELPYISGIAADIGDGQSTASNLSTFTAHLTFAERLFAQLIALAREEPPLLVLLDEVGTGTEPSEGQAFAHGLVSALLDRNVLLAVTTHYSLLKTIGIDRPQEVRNVSLHFDRERLLPTYHVLDNQPGSSFALEIAERWGIPAEVIDIARATLGSEELRMSSVLAELERMKSDAAELRTHALRASAEADVLRKQNEELAISLREAKQRFAKQAEQMKAELKSRIDELLVETKQRLKSKARSASKKHVEFVQAASATSQVAREQEVAAEDALSSLLADLGVEIESMPLDQVPLQLGEIVALEGSALRGEIVTIDQPRQRAEISVGGKRVSVDLRKLRSAGGAAVAHDPLAAYRGTATTSSPQSVKETPSLDASFKLGMQDSFDTLDLHGNTVEEALSRLDEFMSNALLNNATTLRFMHGVGTGRLRQAVLDYLKRNRHVTNVRQAPLKEGGVGVTLADIK